MSLFVNQVTDEWGTSYSLTGLGYGALVVLMLALLMTGALKLDAVEDAGKFMIEIMPVMFIPAAVGLTEAWSSLAPVLLPVAVTTLFTTVLVMAVTGTATQFVIRRTKGDAK